MDIIIPSLILITFNMTGEVPYQLLQQLYTSLLSFRMIKNLSKVCVSSSKTWHTNGFDCFIRLWKLLLQFHSIDAMIFLKLKNICYILNKFLKLYKGNAKNSSCCCTNELWGQVPYNTINYTYPEYWCYNLYTSINFTFSWESQMSLKNSSSMCIFKLCTRLYFMAANC
jgi:hypothetical protein